MVTIFRKKNIQTYQSKTGLMSKREVARAEKMYEELSDSLSELVNKLNKKDSTLKKWYKVGSVLKRLVKKYKLEESNEYETFWTSIYDYIPQSVMRNKNVIPKRSKNWKQNHFYQCMQISKYTWKTVLSVGNWAIWRDLFDNKKIIKDQRILNWLIPKLKKFKKFKIGHKGVRPFLYAISKRLNKIDTSLLTQKELGYKLNQVGYRVDVINKKVNITHIFPARSI